MRSKNVECGDDCGLGMGGLDIPCMAALQKRGGGLILLR
jgi:hypothetical protein